LGIDTAAKILNLAIIDNGEIIADYKVNTVKGTHSSLILPLLESMLKLNGIKPKQLEGIAVSIGPGSFTGLRIGLSTAKGLAFALSIPIIGINTLESYAFKWMDLPGKLCPIIRARRGEYYFTIFQKKNKNLSILENYQCTEWIKIKKKLLSFHGNVYAFGFGLRDIIKEEKIDKSKNIENIYFLTSNQGISSAVSVALIAEKKILAKDYDDINRLSPFYIKKSPAETKT
jgi:tRNA threonylcarbamoyladenosine biosynthesis protein TsaB